MFAPLKARTAASPTKAPAAGAPRPHARSVDDDPREQIRRRNMTTTTPTRGRYYEVHPGGPKTVEEIEASVGLTDGALQTVSYNRARYLDTATGRLELAAPPGGAGSVVWIPMGVGQQAPAADRMVQSVDVSAVPGAIHLAAGMDIERTGKAVIDVQAVGVPDQRVDGEDVRRLLFRNQQIRARAIASVALGGGDLAGWQIGLTRTCHEDSITWTFDRSEVRERMTDASGGPVLDIPQVSTAPFAETASAPAAALQGKPHIFDISDTPQAAAPMANPLGHHDCETLDKLQSMRRILDFSVHAIAFHRDGQHAVLLAHAVFTQEVTVKAVAPLELNPRRTLLRGVSPAFRAMQTFVIRSEGPGAGPLAPELAPRGGRVANDFDEQPVFRETAPC